MKFQKLIPPEQLRHIINCYWFIDSGDDYDIHVQKIIPDGFPELIFHYGDPYEINLSGTWERQSEYLIAGQIKRYFFLRNTGRSGIIGIKLMPAALTDFFGISMHQLTGKVIPLNKAGSGKLSALVDMAISGKSPEEIAARFNTFFEEEALRKPNTAITSNTIFNTILSSKGTASIGEICDKARISERSLERFFHRHVGLTPKYFSRIIRFSNIFKLIEEGDPSWVDVAYLTGYYDQSHFIRDFKAFTGQEPSGYLFEHPSIANFFLKS